MSQILKELRNTESCFDYVIAYGPTKGERVDNLETLSGCDLHVNEQKGPNLWFVMEHNNVNKSPRKVKATLDVSPPSNVAKYKDF